MRPGGAVAAPSPLEAADVGDAGGCDAQTHAPCAPITLHTAHTVPSLQPLRRSDIILGARIKGEAVAGESLKGRGAFG